MSLGLTKPGASVALRHPKTGAVLVPIGYTKSGKAVWPVLGASSDDPDDPAYTDDGGGTGSPPSGDDDDDDEDDDEDDKPAPKPKPKGDGELSRPERQAARYRTERNRLRQELDEVRAELRRRDDEGKPADELIRRDLDEAQSQVVELTEVNQVLTAQLAFFKSNDIAWVDPNDAFALAERAGLFDEVIDESGNVDTAELRRGLRDLAKRKPHLVQKARGRDEDDDEDDEPRSAPTVNKRRGSREPKFDRKTMAKRFPVLGSR